VLAPQLDSATSARTGAMLSEALHIMRASNFR